MTLGYVNLPEAGEQVDRSIAAVTRAGAYTPGSPDPLPGSPECPLTCSRYNLPRRRAFSASKSARHFLTSSLLYLASCPSKALATYWESYTSTADPAEPSSSRSHRIASAAPSSSAVLLDGFEWWKNPRNWGLCSLFSRVLSQQNGELKKLLEIPVPWFPGSLASVKHAREFCYAESKTAALSFC